jgi:hypothetical protein
MRVIVAIAVAAAVAAPALAQEMPKPGPEHARLKEQVGTWETTMKAGGTDTKGTVRFTMDLGGLWLCGAMESELFGTKFQGKSLDSYDPSRKKYVSVWVDSMSTGPVIMEGTYGPDGKTLTMTGEGPGMDGKPAKYKSVTASPDADTMVMTMYIGDGKEPAFTVTYKRKK